jgi:hypothetical protein
VASFITLTKAKILELLGQKADVGDLFEVEDTETKPVERIELDDA